MIYRLPKRLRQALALVLLFLVVGAGGFLFVAPLYSHVRDIDEQIEQERVLAGRLKTMIAQRPQVKASADMAGLYLEGESDSVRLANLQSRLLAIVKGERVRLRSIRNLQPRDRNELHLLGVQIYLAAPIEDLQRILYTVETQQPFMVVDALQMTPFAGVGDEERGLLETRIDVYGIASTGKGG